MRYCADITIRVEFDSPDSGIASRVAEDIADGVKVSPPRGRDAEIVEFRSTLTENGCTCLGLPGRVHSRTGCPNRTEAKYESV